MDSSTKVPTESASDENAESSSCATLPLVQSSAQVSSSKLVQN